VLTGEVGSETSSNSLKYVEYTNPIGTILILDLYKGSYKQSPFCNATLIVDRVAINTKRMKFFPVVDLELPLFFGNVW